MKLFKWALAAIAALAIPVAAQSPTALQPAKTNTAVLPAQVPATGAAPSTAHDLTKADLDTWLDGYMPYALARGDIAGAVVVVVKDGQVLTQRGYGFSDIEKRTPVSPDTRSTM